MRQSGLAAEAVLRELGGRQAAEPEIHGGRLFGLVYPSGRGDVEELILEVNRRYLFGNALNPFRFPEMAALEAEVVGSVAALLNRPEGRRAGTMTSGGSESIVLSMLVHRERARARGVERPEIVAASSAHPAYAKAAHYLGMELVRIPLDSRWRADADAARAAVGSRTAVVVASAFCYPYGVMDPVEELAGIASGVGAGCHVDACIGAFVLPFLERLDREVPPFDFRVPGVTAISADVHKYGYVPKGASVVLHRDDDWSAHQVFLYDQWGAGMYGSGVVAGARPAAPVATSWAVMNYLGVDGYTAVMRDLMVVTDRVRAAVGAMGIDIVGDPIGPVLAMRSDRVDLYAVADTMEARGWYLNRNTDPVGLHLMLSPAHSTVIDQLLDDLASAVEKGGEGRAAPVRYS